MKRGRGEISLSPLPPAPLPFSHELQPNQPSPRRYNSPEHVLLQTESSQGVCRVICFSPRHDLTLPEMELSAIRKVIDAWVAQTAVFPILLKKSVYFFIRCCHVHVYGSLIIIGKYK